MESCWHAAMCSTAKINQLKCFLVFKNKDFVVNSTDFSIIFFVWLFQTKNSKNSNFVKKKLWKDSVFAQDSKKLFVSQLLIFNWWEGKSFKRSLLKIWALHPKRNTILFYELNIVLCAFIYKYIQTGFEEEPWKVCRSETSSNLFTQGK